MHHAEGTLPCLGLITLCGPDARGQTRKSCCEPASDNSNWSELHLHCVHMLQPWRLLAD